MEDGATILAPPEAEPQAQNDPCGLRRLAAIFNISGNNHQIAVQLHAFLEKASRPIPCKDVLYNLVRFTSRRPTPGTLNQVFAAALHVADPGVIYSVNQLKIDVERTLARPLEKGPMRDAYLDARAKKPKLKPQNDVFEAGVCARISCGTADQVESVLRSFVELLASRLRLEVDDAPDRKILEVSVVLKPENPKKTKK